MPTGGQDHHERPHPPSPSRRRIAPAAQVAVVDLRLLSRWRVVLAYRDRRTVGLLRQPGVDVAAEGGQAGPQALLVAQPLPHRRGGVGLQPGLDRLVEPSQLGERRATQLRVHQLGEPLAHMGGPPLAAQRLTSQGLASRGDPGGLGGRYILADGLAVYAQAVGDLGLGPARMPVRQDLDDVDHGEGPPRQRAPPNTPKSQGKSERIISGKGPRWGIP